MNRDEGRTSANQTSCDHSDTFVGSLHDLITAAMGRRPIAWVSSRNVDGVDILEPFSFCSVSSTDPLIVQFTATGGKRSADNAATTGQFVINVVTESTVHQVKATSAGIDESINEFTEIAMDFAPASVVNCLRVRDSPVAIECELHKIFEVGDSQVVMGRVVAVTVDPALCE
jgi:flavin reductase (DIM6/NTAB) family NADH-FMN oxidoreductase RutF